MRLLEIVGADLGRGNLGRDRHDGHARAMAVEQPVDQVQIARTATAGTYCKAAGEMCVGTRGEGGYFFMSYVHPLDAAVS